MTYPLIASIVLVLAAVGVALAEPSSSVSSSSEDAASQTQPQAQPQTPPRPQPKTKTPPAPETFVAEVLDVIDGDTLQVRADRAGDSKEHVVQLTGIDAPEIRQPFGPESQKALADMIMEKPVRVLVLDENPKGELSSIVYIENDCINTAMVRGGFAWRYARPSKALELAQREAERAKRGFWAAPNAIPPWIWIRQHRHLVAKKPGDDWKPASRPGRTSSGSTNNVPSAAQGFWLNTTSGTRHNPWCRYFRNTKYGRPCSPREGTPCNTCGG